MTARSEAVFSRDPDRIHRTICMRELKLADDDVYASGAQGTIVSMGENAEQAQSLP